VNKNEPQTSKVFKGTSILFIKNRHRSYAFFYLYKGRPPPRPYEKPQAIQRAHQTHFFLLVTFLVCLDPDPLSQLNRDPIHLSSESDQIRIDNTWFTDTHLLYPDSALSVYPRLGVHGQQERTELPLSARSKLPMYKTNNKFISKYGMLFTVIISNWHLSGRGRYTVLYRVYQYFLSYLPVLPNSMGG
jgi:hypothetical protein